MRSFMAWRADTFQATTEQLGLTRQQVHEARQIRDAERAQPGIVHRTLNDRVQCGEEPTKAALRLQLLANDPTRQASGTPLPTETLNRWSTKLKAEANMAANQTGTPSQSSSGSPPRRGQQNARDPGLSDQVQGTMRDVAEGASELWDDAYEQGRRYYRQGSRAIGHVDSVTISGWVVAGAIGFGLAWLIFGQRSTDDVARRMSESSERYPRRR